MSARLRVRGLKVAYGGISAVRGVDLDVAQGEVVALIGANGAGKTSTLKALCGMVPVAAGSVEYDGTAITGIPPHQLISRGLALVPEGRGVFPGLSVAENLQMGAYIRDDSKAVAEDLARMYGLFPRLHERRAQAAGTLSGGEQQMLALGRALMGRPRLLMLDEPSMGLAPLMVQKIFEVIRMVAAEGVTILLVEQNALLALQVSHRAYVMESGLISFTDTAQACLDNPRVRAAYLGE